MVVLITSYPQKQLYKTFRFGYNNFFCTMMIHSKPFKTDQSQKLCAN